MNWFRGSETFESTHLLRTSSSAGTADGLQLHPERGEAAEGRDSAAVGDCRDGRHPGALRGTAGWSMRGASAATDRSRGHDDLDVAGVEEHTGQEHRAAECDAAAASERPAEVEPLERGPARPARLGLEGHAGPRHGAVGAAAAAARSGCRVKRVLHSSLIVLLL
eukprot:3349631-Lingulodinium_polyedra.AAC.1